MTTIHSIATTPSEHSNQANITTSNGDETDTFTSEYKNLNSSATGRGPVLTLSESDKTGQLFSKATNDGKLSSEDLTELTRISRKKDDIEQYIAHLQSWPAWNPFKDVSTYSADPEVLLRNKRTLESIDSELRDRQAKCDLLENDVQQFNLEDMKRLRTAAKAISKRHLSGPDTDVLELALQTVYALDKLLRLLRERRTEHDLTQLRLQWETKVCSSWEDVLPIRRDIQAFEHKCCAIMSSRLDMTGTSMVGTQALAKETTADRTRTLATERSPSWTISSARLAGESMKLESSRLVLRVKSFDTEKVRPAGRLLDLLIDQRQVPEKMIDEQERLEDALPQPSALEASSFQLASSLVPVDTIIAEQMETPDMETTQIRDPVPSLSMLDKSDASSSIESSDMPSMTVATRPSSKSISLGSRSRKASTSSPQATDRKPASNRYRSNPRDALDVAVGIIVNRMSMTIAIRPASLTVSSTSQRSSTTQDLSGQYWIGEPDPRLCFCRILPSSTVMVRVGGGWQELSEFLIQHYAHLSARDVDAHSALSFASSARSGANRTWFRSASGPTGYPHLKPKSSLGSLSSCEQMRLRTPKKASRVVTMPVRMRNHSSTHAAQQTRSPEVHTTKIAAADDQRQTTSRSSSQRFELSSSESGSSCIIHPSSPSP